MAEAPVLRIFNITHWPKFFWFEDVTAMLRKLNDLTLLNNVTSKIYLHIPLFKNFLAAIVKYDSVISVFRFLSKILTMHVKPQFSDGTHLFSPNILYFS